MITSTAKLARIGKSWQAHYKFSFAVDTIAKGLLSSLYAKCETNKEHDMRELTKNEIEILNRHAKWLCREEGGERANLSGANLSGADMSDADLRCSNLRCADLSDADLRDADMRGANLRGANLRGADLSYADLRYADMSGANLSCANLSGADLDYSAWPLYCGSTGAIAGDRLFAQLLFHLTRLDVSNCSGGVKEAMQHIRNMAAADLFCEYRYDVKTIADDERFAKDCK